MNNEIMNMVIESGVEMVAQKLIDKIGSDAASLTQEQALQILNNLGFFQEAAENYSLTISGLVA